MDPNWFFTIVADAAPKNGKIFGEEYGLEEIEKQLKAINKPAIKSFTTDRGDIFDCVDINKQLAFDHPLLKNHTIQKVPNLVSKRKNAPIRFECPHGTVIVKRITKQDLLSAHKLKSTGFESLSPQTNGIRPNGHHSAGLGYRGQVSEASGHINAWSPGVSPRQFSQSRVLVSRQYNSIQAGWQVYSARWDNPPRWDNDTRFYTYWTADGFKKRGCFDMHCPGFVQISQTNPLGTYADAFSARDHRQYYIDVKISRDPHSGNWLLFYETEAIGYWPKELFTAKGLSQVASYASWGGEVYSPIGEKSPPMGSGSFAQEGYQRAAFVNAIKVRDGLWRLTKPVGVKVYADQPKCYNAKYFTSSDGEPWTTSVFFGGPGGC
ncbi:PREDICTED: uncharacterized protein LOC104783060 [Camelina sativa]|uniref:Uncharacterized protein LOC104783060 n=1 Tax=Camelina sativa TaxID=90675 RepID=A0ABM1RLC3_CAMSA|nr:PREDICTED: uncharacterized protein LOC104783060 [Camelina sativa]